MGFLLILEEGGKPVAQPQVREGTLFRAAKTFATTKRVRTGGRTVIRGRKVRFVGKGRVISRGTRLRYLGKAGKEMDVYAPIGPSGLTDRSKLVTFLAGCFEEQTLLKMAPVIKVVDTETEMEEAVVNGSCVAAIVEKSQSIRHPFCHILCKDKRTAKAVAKVLGKNGTPKRARNGRPCFKCLWDLKDTATMLDFYGFFNIVFTATDPVI